MVNSGTQSQYIYLNTKRYTLMTQLISQIIYLHE